MAKRVKFMLFICGLAAPLLSASAETSPGARSWSLDKPGSFKLDIEQRLPDQLVAFYVGRGMSAGSSEHYAHSCVFLARLTNTSKAMKLGSDFSKWRLRVNGKDRKIPTTADWQSQWVKAKEQQAAVVAFQWSQFPAIQNHDPGDWYQGMFSTRLPAGSKFDLLVVWTENGKPKQDLLRDLQCAD